MRVLVCGGRDYRNKAHVFAELDAVSPTFLIEGGADGADAWAWQWAKRNLTPECRLSIQARWDQHGKAAGPMRNQRMIDEGKPDLVIAFPGGRGTADMVKRARAAGIEVREVAPLPAP